MSSISEIAKQYNFSASAIRYYESQELIKIPRDESGQRFFDPKTKERIRLLVHLRQAGLSMVEMKNYLNHLQDHDYEVRLLEQSHKRLTDKIEQMKQTLNFLDYKIEYHKNSKTNEHVLN
ncbi:MAG: MerR family transcriptional regulator [Oenococcus oeni]